MAKIQYYKTPLIDDVSLHTVPSDEYLDIVEKKLKFSSEYLKIVATYEPTQVNANFMQPTLFFKCVVTYADDIVDVVKTAIKQSSKIDELYTSSVVVPLQGSEVVKISLICINDSEQSITIKSIKVYNSKDLQQDTLESGLKEVAEFKQNCEYLELLSDGSGFGYKFEGENPQNFIFLTNSTGALTGIVRQEDGYVTQIRTKNV